jgi:hypothetical protein
MAQKAAARISSGFLERPMRLNVWTGLALALLSCRVSAAESAPATAVTKSPLQLVVVHFAIGPSWRAGMAPAEQPGFREHSANLGALRARGSIVFGARYGELGMIVLRVESLEAARTLIASDPGVQAGLFTFQLAPISVFYPWQEPATQLP